MSASPAPASGIGLKSQFFEGLTPRDLKTVLGAATRRRFFANSVVFSQGNPADSFFLLLEGRARHFYLTEQGQKILGPWVMPGEIFGSAALLASMSPYLVSAETVKDSSVLMWNKAGIRSLLLRYPKLMDNMLSINRDYLEWALAMNISLACHSARLRLAQAILNLARDIGADTRGRIELHVTNEELANAANVTPFTASRLMREWHRRGALTKSRGKVLLRSPEKLVSRDGPTLPPWSSL